MKKKYEYEYTDFTLSKSDLSTLQGRINAELIDIDMQVKELEHLHSLVELDIQALKHMHKRLSKVKNGVPS